MYRWYRRVYAEYLPQAGDVQENTKAAGPSTVEEDRDGTYCVGFLMFLTVITSTPQFRFILFYLFSPTTLRD